MVCGVRCSLARSGFHGVHDADVHGLHLDLLRMVGLLATSRMQVNSVLVPLKHCLTRQYTLHTELACAR